MHRVEVRKNTGHQLSNVNCAWTLYSEVADIRPSVQAMACAVEPGTEIVIYDGPSDAYPIMAYVPCLQ